MKIYVIYYEDHDANEIIMQCSTLCENEAEKICDRMNDMDTLNSYYYKLVPYDDMDDYLTEMKEKIENAFKKKKELAEQKAIFEKRNEQRRLQAQFNNDQPYGGLMYQLGDPYAFQSSNSMIYSYKPRHWTQ